MVLSRESSEPLAVGLELLSVRTPARAGQSVSVARSIARSNPPAAEQIQQHDLRFLSEPGQRCGAISEYFKVLRFLESFRLRCKVL